jgi:hypothetical protein
MLADPPSGATLLRSLVNLSNNTYRVLLEALGVTFTLGDRAAGLLIEQSRRAMFSLHETNHLLASNGARPPFQLPPALPAGLVAPDTTESFVDELAASTRQALAAVADAGGEAEQAFAARQQRRYGDLFTRMRQLMAEERN